MSKYVHPTTIASFEAIYKKEYAQEIETSVNWIKFSKEQNDMYGVNFHQGMQAALQFNNTKMHQLIRVLKQEYPNATETKKAKP